MLFSPIQVISTLLQTMKDQSNPRVQAHAAAALINFTEDCPKSLLIPYLDSLVQELHITMVAKLQEVMSVRPVCLLLGGQDTYTSLYPFTQLIHKGTKLVLEQVVTSIASVADTAEEKFVPYYDLFMPSLKDIVVNAVQKELRLLRGKTIECISLIGLAVGKEKVCHVLHSSPELKQLPVWTDGLKPLYVGLLVHARRLSSHAAAPQNTDRLRRPGG